MLLVSLFTVRKTGLNNRKCNKTTKTEKTAMTKIACCLFQVEFAKIKYCDKFFHRFIHQIELNFIYSLTLIK